MRYVVIPKESAIAIALWIVHTYALDAAGCAPILAVLSPEKRCGKTLLLGLLIPLVRRPLPASNTTPAVVFRAIEQWSPTLLVDEADSFLEAREELRGVLNSGHTRTTAYVLRTAGDDHEPRAFSTWCAKAIAMIGRLPATLEDHSLVIPMKRRKPGEKVKRFRLRKVGPAPEILRRKTHRWAQDNMEMLKDADPEVPEELNDRAQDNWRPLLAIADLTGGPWAAAARKAALKLSGSDSAEARSLPQIQSHLKPLREMLV